MCNDYEAVNKLIQEKKDNPFRGLDDATYINESVWREFAKHRDLKTCACVRFEIQVQMDR